VKTLFLILCLLVLPSVLRADTTNLFPTAAVNGTNNGGTFAVSNVYFPPQNFLFQIGAISNAWFSGVTNIVAINFQISVDAANTNWLTLATYHPSSTNGITEKFTGPTGAACITTLVGRAQIVTSNSIQITTYKTD